MSKIQKTIKIQEDINEAVEEWIAKNNNVINFSVLTEMALRKFISEPVTLEPVYMKQDEVMKVTQNVMKKHRKALDRMK